MEFYDVLNVYVEYVVPLNSEDGVFNIVIFHVDSRGVGASKIIYIRLIFDVYAWCDVVSC